MDGDSDDDDRPQLSAHTLAALQEFMIEQAVQAEQEAAPEMAAMPQEDWQLSQFWYTEETALKLAEEAIAAAGEGGRIACISCPTLYKKLIDLAGERTWTAVILEYDKRFKKFGNEFLFYDYNDPLNLPKDFAHAFDIVVADPPFLNEECLEKTCRTIRYMAKEKILLCTGAIMEKKAAELLNARPISFKPQHSKQLNNPFLCFTNYETLKLK
ncbi:EEF1A lysine methyltransferase 1-like isoform X2 [Lineus longissimus]|uniref:EEF1A lysine methyltransferase 1-like isoform X2 n=1 Tax=Lineus longissimus TaxID=88925 RepID=UPI002B4D62CD